MFLPFNFLLTNYEMLLIQVTKVILGDGRSLSTSLVVVGIGARPNLGPFKGLLEEEKGGFKVNIQILNSNLVYNAHLLCS